MADAGFTVDKRGRHAAIKEELMAPGIVQGGCTEIPQPPKDKLCSGSNKSAPAEDVPYKGRCPDCGWSVMRDSSGLLSPHKKPEDR